MTRTSPLLCTPGAIRANSVMFDEDTGTNACVRLSTTRPEDAVAESSSGASAVTVTVSVTAPTSSVTLISTLLATVSTMPRRTVARNPGASALT